MSQLSFRAGMVVDHNELKAIRAGLRLTQTEMATSIGISRVFFGLMERGERPISKRTAEAIRAVRPKPLNVVTREADPLYRRFEQALISSGIGFEVKHDSEAEIVTYHLERPKLQLCISRYDRGAISKKISAEVEGLYLLGASSAKFMCDLIEIAGGRAGNAPP